MLKLGNAEFLLKSKKFGRQFFLLIWTLYSKKYIESEYWHHTILNYL
jgi:hypothetical protein